MNPLRRRDAMRMGVFGAAGLSSYFGGIASASEHSLAPKPPHFPAKAKRVIQIFLPGGVSHVDTFDPKDTLNPDSGSSIT